MNDRTTNDRPAHATTKRCPEFAWCTMTDPGEHDQFHASNDVLLGDPNGDGDFRSAWLVRDVDATETSLVIEMRLNGTLMETQLPAYGAAVLLAAATDRECRFGMEWLLQQVAER